MTIACDPQDVHLSASQRLCEQLRHLLARQIQLAQCGKIAELERLTPQVDAVIARIVTAPTGRPLVSRTQRERLKEQYDDLVLALRAQQAEVQTKLKQTREVKRVVSAYRRKKRR